MESRWRAIDDYDRYNDMDQMSGKFRDSDYLVIAGDSGSQTKEQTMLLELTENRY